MYDVVIIGAGPGGYVAAVRAAQNGLKTAVIDERVLPGGTCLQVGCIPSKALLQTSYEFYRLKEKGKELGIECGTPSFNWDVMQKRKESVVDGLVKSVSSLLKGHQVDYKIGRATFINASTLKVGEERISSRYFVIATGSEPISLPFLPFDEKEILSSTGALALKSVPGKMVVIGGGVIGVELASVYARLGTHVTVVETLDRLCPSLDTALSRALLSSLKKQGIEFHLSTKVTGYTKNKVQIEGGELAADVVLVAVGRRPVTASLELEKAGVELKKGFVVVNRSFQTTNPRVYAIGDVIEGPMLAHRASEEGIAVADILAGRSAHVDYIAIPNVVYTHPEVASVGLTEQQAKEASFNLAVGISSFKGNPRARTADEAEGMVKIIGDKESGKLLGLHIIGPQASELIAEGVVAITKRATLQEIAFAPHAHPTLSEAIKEAALAAIGQSLHQ